MKIAILGGGSWGTALAVHLAKNNHQIKIWEFFEEQARKMQEERLCPLLPEAPLAENIMVSSKMADVLSEVELILLVVPSDKVEMTLQSASDLIKDQPIIICSKGFGSDLKLLHDIVQEKVSGPVYCLYGPTHAEEVCKGMFSGIVLAGGEGKEAGVKPTETAPNPPPLEESNREEKGNQSIEELKKVIESPHLKVDLSDDLIGVQVSAALKNILAVFIGAVRGAGLGDNTAAYIITKGLQEIKQVGMKMGAKAETFYGLAGLGDVFVTCTSEHSRNFTVGKKVGEGCPLDDVLGEMKMVAEGVTTAKCIPELKEKYELELPLLTGVHEILFAGKNVKEVLKNL